MARTPLYPRGGDFTTWALNITQRIERDYAELKNDTVNVSSNIASVSAEITAALRSVSLCLTADIATSEANSRANFLSNDASLSAVLYAAITSVATQANTDLHSVSDVIKADISSVSFVIKQDISSVAADIIAGMYGGMITEADLRSLSVDIQASIDSISNTVSFLNTLVVNVKAPAYGAVGDGTINDTTAVATALAAAKGKVLYFPAGTYRMEAAITLTGGIRIEGAGMSQTQLRWSSSAASSGIALLGTAATYNEFHSVRNLTLATAKVTPTDTALTFDYSAQVVTLTGGTALTLDRLRYRYLAENVEVTGTGILDSDDATLNGWLVGIHILASPGGTCHNVVVNGKALSAVQGVTNAAGIYIEGVAGAGFENGHPVIALQDKCFLNFWQYGIISSNVEGVYIKNCNAVACDYGYFVLSSAGHPQATIIGNHANSYVNACRVAGQTQFSIIGNLFYTIQTAPGSSNPVVILSSYSGSVIGNTCYVSGSNTAGPGIYIVDSHDIAVSDNNAFGPYLTYCVQLAADASSIRGANNTAWNLPIGGKAVNDLGTDNRMEVESYLVTSVSAGESAFTFSDFGYDGGTAAKVYRRLHADNPGTHTNTSFAAFGIEYRPVGSGINGPSSADFGLNISVFKRSLSSSPTSAVTGELDGINIVMRQGGDHNDVGGWLANVAHYGTGYTAIFEGVAAILNTLSAVYQIRLQGGSMNNVTTSFFTGLNIIAEQGTFDHGLYISVANVASCGYARYISCALPEGTLAFTIQSDGSIVSKSYCNADGGFKVGGTQVVGSRSTGWVPMAGPGNIDTTITAAADVSLLYLSARVNSIQYWLTQHGLIGA